MRPKKRNFTPYYIGAGIVFAAILVWSVIPPLSISLDGSCKPEGLRAAISSSFVKRAFWSNQRDALESERFDLLALQNNGNNDPDGDDTSVIEQHMERMSGREQHAADIQERKRKLMEKRKLERLERLAWLMKCSEMADRY
jgi:hypothetical protein